MALKRKRGPCLSQSQLTDLVLSCLQNHNAMTCFVRGKERVVLPLSVQGDRLTVMPLGLGPAQEVSSVALRLGSIRRPHVEELNMRPSDLKLIHLAMRQSVPLWLHYLDASGREVWDSTLIPKEEQDGFLCCVRTAPKNESIRIRMKWIAQVNGSLQEVDPAKRRAFITELLMSEDPRLRKVVPRQAAFLDKAEYFTLLLRLCADPDPEVRASIADELRMYVQRVLPAQDVLRRTYSFLDREKDPRLFEVLAKLADDESSSVRSKTADVLISLPSAQGITILDRLVLDPDQTVRKGARFARDWMAENYAGFAVRMGLKIKRNLLLGLSSLVGSFIALAIYLSLIGISSFIGDYIFGENGMVVSFMISLAVIFLFMRKVNRDPIEQAFRDKYLRNLGIRRGNDLARVPLE